MNDRIYLRANFSSATANPSSGAHIRNEEGEEYARIPLQLPNNFIDPTKTPNNIEMMLTKLDIPLGSIPITEVPLRSIEDQANPMSQTSLLTAVSKAACTIWPFQVFGGEVLPASWNASGYYNVEGMDSVGWRDKWPIRFMDLPIQLQAGTEEFISYQQKLLSTKMIPIDSISLFTNFLTRNFNAVLDTVFNAKYYGDSTQDGDNDKDKQEMEFSIENGRLILRTRNRGAVNQSVFTPFNSKVFTNDGTFILEKAGTPVVKQAYTPDGDIYPYFTDSQIFGYSLVGNKVLRDLLPGFPWIKVRNDKLPVFRLSNDVPLGQSIPGWSEFGDTEPNNFYVLNLWDLDFTWGAEETYIHRNQSGPPYTGEFYTVKVHPGVYTFTGVNLLSITNITSFVVMINGLTITPQTFPVNINPANTGAAQNTTIPIVEVYFPLFNSIEDLSTNLIVSKDAFTNAAPFVVTPDALLERNLVFEVYYITRDGGLHLLTIPPGTSVSLQICYSITY